jgi:hypothetical protein
VRSFWPFQLSEDLGSYAKMHALPVMSVASSDSVLPSTRNSVARMSLGVQDVRGVGIQGSTSFRV